MAIIKKQSLEKLKNKASDLLNRTLDQHIHLAVTGLSRSGKTAFITSLVNQLINEGNGHQLSFFDPVHQGNFIAAKRVPQKNLTVPRFDYDRAISSLTQQHPSWPEPTHGISELRLAIRYQPQKSLRKYTTDMATLTVDISDYPGEWLLDLPMLNQTYEQWSEQTFALLMAEPRQKHAQVFLDKVAELDPFAIADEELLAEIAQEYTQLLHTFRYQLGLSVIQPGRFILPAELAGAPILEFFPFVKINELDGNEYQNASDDSLIGMLRARFIEYKESVVKKFYQQHFLRFDRQIVLSDCLTPLNTCSENAGPESFADLQHAIDMILESYRYGKTGLFARLFSPKIDKLLFVATKADHVTAEQHAPMVSLLNQLIYQSKHKLNYDAIEIKTLAIAAIKSTLAGKSFHHGEQISVIQGLKLTDIENKTANTKITVFPGAVPDKLPAPDYWKSAAFNFINFAPPVGLSKHKCLPHIRMDQVLQFLLADKMI